LDLRGRKWRENGEDCIIRSFITTLRFANYYEGDKIKKGEMGGQCSMHGIDEKCIQNFRRKTSRDATTRKN
jgi:hypothetical protein